METDSCSTAQQLNSSTAQQLNSSTAQQLNSSTPGREWLPVTFSVSEPFVGSMLIVLLLASASGCDITDRSTVPLAVASSESRVMSNGTLDALDRLDLGVIDYQRGGYVCLPLDRLGIADANQIVGLETSCDCTTARLVEYLQLDGSYGSAVRIDIEGESGSSDGNADDPSGPQPFSEDSVRPFNLAVNVTIHLANSQSREVTVAFLQSPMRPGGRS